MDNNKIVDNLNFIKIYFKVFIYKIFVTEKTWIIKKRDKIYEYNLKTRLSVRPGSRKPKKEVQNALEHKSAIIIQEYHLALLECRSELSKCRMAPLRALAQCSLCDNKALPFQIFHRKSHHSSHSTHRCLFFKHSNLYK